MNQSPFAILRPFQDVLDVVLFTKADGIHDDEGVRRALGWERLATTKQVHGSRTIYVDDETRREDEADGMVTDEPDLGLAMRSADCQIIAFFDPRMGAIGMAHAGWRGLLNQVIPSCVSSMTRSFRISPSDLYAVAGPSLCTKCAGFTNPQEELKGIDPKFFDGRHVNLHGIAEEQLFALGIRPDRFERHPGCTRCEPDTYWSYRANPEPVKQGSHNVLAMRLKPVDADEEY